MDMPREVVCQGDPAGKDQPVACDAPGFRLSSQVFDCNGQLSQKPKHATFDFFQQAHPNVENVGKNLVPVVEATKDEALVWKPQF